MGRWRTKDQINVPFTSTDSDFSSQIVNNFPLYGMLCNIWAHGEQVVQDVFAQRITVFTGAGMVGELSKIVGKMFRCRHSIPRVPPDLVNYLRLHQRPTFEARRRK